MKELITHAIKKVTLELVYEVVDERTARILERIEKLEKRQEDDFRYLINKIDDLRTELRGEVGQVRSEIGQVRGEVGQVRSEIGQLRSDIGQIKDDLRIELREEVGQVRGEIGQVRSEISMLNQRFDSVIQLIMSIKQHDR